MFFFNFSLILLSYGCISGDAAGPDDGADNVTPSGILMIYVDSELGVDDGESAGNKTFKTITYALNVIQSNEGFKDVQTIRVSPGIYSNENGEVFPLELTDWMQLSAYYGAMIENNSVESSNIYGFDGPVTVTMEGNAKINNFTIKSQENSAGILIKSGSPQIFHNEISGHKVGIIVMADASPVIKSNIIKSNIIGIENLASSIAKIHSNEIIENAAGVNIFNLSNPDLGSVGTQGLNTIQKNTNYDLCNVTSNTIWAIGNIWDDASTLISISGSCNNGVDIGNVLSGAVIYLDLPQDKNPIFNRAKTISLQTPFIGEVIDDDTPNFSWQMDAANIVALGVFNKRIIIRNNEITNKEDLVYFWHSGMSAGRPGSIEYNDGRRYIDGELEQSEIPSALERGKTYFWSVWAWDNEGLSVTQSGPEGYFTIRY